MKKIKLIMIATIALGFSPFANALVCGDGEPDAGEQCDDGNNASGDGCSSVCDIEAGFLCSDAIASIVEPETLAIPSACLSDTALGIDIEKSTNGEDADIPTGPLIAVGQSVNWTYTVTNTGTVDITDIVVTDDQSVAVSCPQGTLTFDESMICTASGIATTGQYANVGDVIASSVREGIDVTDDDPSHYYGISPSIDIEKLTNGVDADDPLAGDAPQILVGEQVNWTYMVTNTGDVPLSNVIVTDDQSVVVSCPQDTLAVDESMNCNASGPAVDVLNTGFLTVPGTCGAYTDMLLYENEGEASGEYQAGQTVEDQDSSHYCNVIGTFSVDVGYSDGNATPVTITASCTGNGTFLDNPLFAAPGSPAEFIYTGFSGTPVCTALASGLPEGYTTDNSDCQDNDDLNQSCMINSTKLTNLAGNDGLGDAGLFQYYTVNGNWQTFIRLINTSADGVSVKLRFREAANSREVLDFIVFLSPYDMWVAWTDDTANGLPDAGPGIRTNDTSCVYPDSGNAVGQGWINISGKPGVRGIAFQDYAFTGIYDDGGTGDGVDGPTALQRMSEGHIEVIGIARHKLKDNFTSNISHAANGAPSSCYAASSDWLSGIGGAKGADLGNVLAMNGYLINVSMGQGAGYEPDILADFASGKSLWESQLYTATDPDLDSATAGPGNGQGMKQKGSLMDLVGARQVTGGVEAISYLLQRSSVINEWAASQNDDPDAVVTDYFSQWVVTFPTKHYYVDLQNDDINVTDDISPTLADPGIGNDALAPFYEEFDYGDGDQLVSGQSCEPYRIRMWNREERWSSYTSPAPDFPAQLCYETNVLVFNERYEDKGLNSNFATTVPAALLPTQIDGFTPSERGWASVDFYDGDSDFGTGIGLAIESRRFILDRAGLPVTGFMFSVYNTNDLLTNHTAINAHKYRRDEGHTARLTLIKTINNPNGGDALVEDWALSASGPEEISGSTGDGSITNADVLLGPYTLYESGPDGYTSGPWVCNGGVQMGNEITLGKGDDVTCTINSDGDLAHLTLVKIVFNDNNDSNVDEAPTAWMLNADGPTPISGPGGADSDVYAGTYTLSETGPDDYLAGPWSCVGGTQNGDQLTLGLGESATCTVINDDYAAASEGCTAVNAGLWNDVAEVDGLAALTSIKIDLTFFAGETIFIRINVESGGGEGHFSLIPEVNPPDEVYSIEFPNGVYPATDFEGQYTTTGVDDLVLNASLFVLGEVDGFVTAVSTLTCQPGS